MEQDLQTVISHDRKKYKAGCWIQFLSCPDRWDINQSGTETGCLRPDGIQFPWPKWNSQKLEAAKSLVHSGWTYLFILWMETLLHHLGLFKPYCNNGINYQPQLVRRISANSIIQMNLELLNMPRIYSYVPKSYGTYILPGNPFLTFTESTGFNRMPSSKGPSKHVGQKRGPFGRLKLKRGSDILVFFWCICFLGNVKII